jgi:hypothetical protein
LQRDHDPEHDAHHGHVNDQVEVEEGEVEKKMAAITKMAMTAEVTGWAAMGPRDLMDDS